MNYEPPITIAVDDGNDIYLLNGDLAIASGKDAMAQAIAAAIRTLKGELQLDMERGIPYFETIFAYSGIRYIEIWASYVKDTVSQFSFVSSIKSFEYSVDYPNSALRYNMVIETVDNDTITLNESV